MEIFSSQAVTTRKKKTDESKGKHTELKELKPFAMFQLTLVIPGSTFSSILTFSFFVSRLFTRKRQEKDVSGEKGRRSGVVKAINIFSFFSNFV
jgi:hypothetical protein